jgi:hypothetical protein
MSKQQTIRKKESPARPAARAAKRPSVVESIWEPTSVMAILFFALLVVIFFWGQLTGSAFFWEDFTEAFYPYQSFAARNFTSGIIPYWNPYTFNGMPFLADLQNGIFYPGNQLMYHLSGGNLSSWLAQFFIILHYLIAMLGVWKLARSFDISQWGSAIAAIGYGFGGLMVAHAMHHNMIFHEAWFPWIVYFFYQGVRRRNLFYSFSAGLILGLMLLAGHPQLALYIVFFLFCLTIFLLVRDLRAPATEEDTRPGIGVGIAAAAIPIIIGSGIFAIQLLPGMELAALSERANFTYEQTLEGALGAGQLLTLIVPKLFGIAGPAVTAETQFWYRPEPHYFWETAIYIGVVTLILAAVGLASRRLGALGWFLGAMGLFGILYALGDSFVLHPLFGRLPLFNSFRIPTRMALYFALGGSLLAGVGLDRLLKGEGERSTGKESRVALIVGGFIVLIGLLAASGILTGMFNPPQGLGEKTGASGVVALLIGGIATAVIWARLGGRIAGTAVAPILLLLAVIDMFAFGMGQNDSKEDPQAQIYQPLSQQFAAYRSEPPSKIFRVKSREGGAMLMPRNAGPYSNIMLYEGYNALRLQRRVPPVTDTERAFDLLNIRYDVRVDSATGGMGLVERPTAFPHARMIYDVQVVDSARAHALLSSGGIDLARSAVVEDDPGIKFDGTGNGQATITRYDASEIEVKVTTDKPGLLLLSEIWYPAWQVTIDGAPAKLLRANHSLRGIAIPAGTYTVALHFESSAFRTGTWITIASLLVGVVGAAVLGMRKRKT